MMRAFDRNPKLLGEQVCAYFHRTHNLPIMILRLFLPIPDEKKQIPESVIHPPSSTPNPPDCRTAASDLARALAAALKYEHKGLEIIHLTGDTTDQASLKCVELKNLCCQSLSELRVELRPSPTV